MAITRIHKTTNDNTTGSVETLGQIEDTDLATSALELFIDEKVAVSGTDTTPDYLLNKITAGDGINLDTLNGGADEQLEINSKGQVKVSSNDTTIAYVDDKLTVGDYLVKTINDEGDNETIELDWIPESIMGLHRGWRSETKSAFGTRADETTLDVDSDDLDPVTGSVKNIVYRPDTSAAGSLGTFQSIGKTSAMGFTEWAAVHGLLFEIACEQDNWFNVKNNATIADTNFKKILTVSNKDEHFISRALFSYDNVDECWYLIAHTPAAGFKRASIPVGAGNTDIEAITNLPQIGYYKYDVYVTTLEVDHDSNTVNTAAAQTLSVLTKDDTPSTYETQTVDSSATFAPAGTSTDKFVNNSLQGSGIIYVPNAAIGNRKIYVNAGLPNGETQTIEGGYIHVLYLGKVLGV